MPTSPRIRARIDVAAGVFAVTDDDNRNLMISLTAKQLNPRLRGGGVLPGVPQHPQAAQGWRRRGGLPGLHRGHSFVFNPPQDFVVRPGHVLVTMRSPQGRQALEQRFVAA